MQLSPWMIKTFRSKYELNMLNIKLLNNNLIYFSLLSLWIYLQRYDFIYRYPKTLIWNKCKYGSYGPQHEKEYWKYFRTNCWKELLWIAFQDKLLKTQKYSVIRNNWLIRSKICNWNKSRFDYCLEDHIVIVI